MHAFGQAAHVQSPSRGVTHPTQGHDPRPLVATGDHAVDIDPSPGTAHAPGIDAARRQIQPGIEVAGELVLERHNIVTGSPGIPLGHEADARRGAGHQCHLVRRGIDQPRDALSQLADRAVPQTPGRVPFTGRLPCPILDRGRGRAGQGSDGGVVQKGPAAGHGHLLSKLGPEFRRHPRYAPETPRLAKRDGQRILSRTTSWPRSTQTRSAPLAEKTSAQRPHNRILRPLATRSKSIRCGILRHLFRSYRPLILDFPETILA
jgi:hypothetical protein